MFTLGAEYLPETTTVSQMTDDGKNVKFAALFILMKLENYLVAFLDAIKNIIGLSDTRFSFINTLVELMEKLSEDGKQKGAFFLKSQPKKLKHIISFERMLLVNCQSSKSTLVSREVISHTLRAKWVVLFSLMRRKKKRVGL